MVCNSTRTHIPTPDRSWDVGAAPCVCREAEGVQTIAVYVDEEMTASPHDHSHPVATIRPFGSFACVLRLFAYSAGHCKE
jgi:hypothetical protein